MSRLLTMSATAAVITAAGLMLLPTPGRTDAQGKDPKKVLSPAKHHPDFVKYVAMSLSRYHYSQQKIDDTLSERWFEHYLSALDPQRLYFMASDISEFQRWRLQLDEAVNGWKANLSPAFTIYERYQQRLLERTEVALKLLEGPLNLEDAETMRIDHSEAPWPKDRKELDELWRKRIEDDVIRGLLMGTDKKKVVERLTKRYQRLRNRVKQSDPVDVLDRFLSAFASSYDPHSAYLRPMAKEDFDLNMSGRYEGIGAALTVRGDHVVVTELLAGGPAALGELLEPEDHILAVAQGTESPVDVVGMRLDKVVKLIRGKGGTEVRLTVAREESGVLGPAKIVSIIRDEVKLQEVNVEARVEKVKRTGGGEVKLGVLEVPSFYVDNAARRAGDANYKSVTRDVEKGIRDLKKEGVTALVLDLRGNGGGSLDEAISLAGLFIEKGPVVQVRDTRGEVEVQIDEDPAVAYRGPLVVLTDVFSASASEIVAAALQDYGRAVVVGASATHGKGTVQQVLPLERMLGRIMPSTDVSDVAGALKLTTHMFYRVNGRSTQLDGVTPDLVLPSPFDGYDLGERKLDFPLRGDSIKAVKHADYGIKRTLLDELAKRSKQRVAKDEGFTEIVTDAAERKKIRDQGVLSLKLETRKKERDERLSDEEKKELEAKQAAEKNGKKKKGKDKKEEKKDLPDPILLEALQVARDLVSLAK